VKSVVGLAALFLAAIAPASAQPAYSWTGFYGVVHLGWGSSPITYYDPAFPDWYLSHRPHGLIGGGQAGFNYQNGRWVFGVEGDLSGAAITKSVVDDKPGFAGDVFEADVKWIATAAGRVGYAWDRWLIYGKGGAARAHSELRFQYVQQAGFGPTKLQSTRTGWMAGGGVEYAFRPGWSLKLEYNYVDFGRSGLVTFLPLPDGFVATFSQRLHLIKFGLNYRFWT